MRLKSPAYGRKLLEERRAGIHPLSVMLVYGDKWGDVDPPKLCIKPDDYQPAKFDFHCVAGIQVIVFDQALGWCETDQNVIPPTYGKFYDLLAELAGAGAYVELEWPRESGFAALRLSTLALWATYWDRSAGRRQWPRWWSDELEAKHEERWCALARHRAREAGILERECGRAA